MAKMHVMYTEFNKGLSEVMTDTMADDELLVAQNAIPGERGGITKCKGVRKIKISQNPADTHQFKNETTSPHFIAGDYVFFKDNKYTVTVVGSTTAGLTAYCSEITGHDSVPVPDVSFVYNGTRYFLNAYEGVMYKETQTSPFVSVNCPTMFKFFNLYHTAVYKERVFYMGENKIYYSEIGDPTTVAEANVLYFGGNTLTAMVEFGGSLLISTEDEWFALSGVDVATATLKKLDVPRGTFSYKTICQIENMLVFLATDGVYGLVTPYPDLITSINLTENKLSGLLQKARLSSASAVFINGFYRLSLRYVVVREDGTYEPDYTREEYRMKITPSSEGVHTAWFGPFTFPVEQYIEWAVTNIGPMVFVFSVGKNDIFQLDVGHSYNDEPIPFIIETKPFDVTKHFAREHRFRKLFIGVKQYEKESSTVEGTVKADYTEQSFKSSEALNLNESLVYEKGSWGEAVWGWSEFIIKEIRLSGMKGKRIQVRLENSVKDEPLTIYGIGFEYSPGRMRGSASGMLPGS